MTEADLKFLFETFDSRFGKGEMPSVYFAPGRINIIGEHLDYNGGFVLPCALKEGTHLAIRKRKDSRVLMHSEGFDAELITSWDQLSSASKGRWWNYPLGVFHEFSRVSNRLTGFELFFSGNLPRGRGLSSSASIEVVTAFALNEMMSCGMELKELALLCRKAENEFVGVQCGIMDQFAATFGKANHAIMLNTSTLDFEFIPLDLRHCSFVITDTNKPRQLESSAFNERFMECGDALRSIQRLKSVEEIAELTPHEFDEIECWLPDEKARKRARHIVYENERVKQAGAALTNGELWELASLMNESHASSRDEYEVSCFELESLIHACRTSAGCMGARISGAGFGGCTLNLVETRSIPEFRFQVIVKYKRLTGLQAGFYDVEIGGGVMRLA